MCTLAHTHKQVYDNSVKWTASHSNPVSLRLPIIHTLHLQPCTWDVEVKHEDKPGPSFSLRFQLMSSVTSLPYVARPKQRVSRLKSTVRVCQGASVLSTLCDQWTVAHQAPLSTGFPSQECWCGLPFPCPGDLPHLGIKPVSPASPAFAGRFFTLSHLGTHSTQV